MADTPKPDRGGSFYDDQELFDNYLSLRHARASANRVMENPAFMTAVGDLAGQRIVDLGCGDGTFAQAAVEAGCRSYLGLDGSHRMIEKASAKMHDPSVSFSVVDMEDFSPEPATADLVVTRMALHYLADLRPVVAAARKALVPGGRFVATVVHPVVSASLQPDSKIQRTSVVVDDYFSTGARPRRWLGKSVVWYHRTVEQYVSNVIDAGFSLTRLSDCEPVPELFNGDTDELERRRRVPLILLLEGTVPLL